MAAPNAPEIENDDEDLLAQAKADWRRAYSHWRKWRAEAKEDFAFVAGDQWNAEDKLFLDRQGRPVVAFNRIAPMVDAVAGSEVQNRQEVRYIARELGDAAVNEALTAATKYFRDISDAEDEESAAFFDCVVCGIGWTETRLDHDEDPDGTIVIEQVDPFEIFADPSARKGNLADAKFIFRVKDLTKDEVEREWPGATDRLMPGAFAWGDVDEDEDEPHHRVPGQQYEVGGKGTTGRQRRKRYRVVEYQWKDYKTVYRYVDLKTGQEAEVTGERWSKVQRMVQKVAKDLKKARKDKAEAVEEASAEAQRFEKLEPKARQLLEEANAARALAEDAIRQTGVPDKALENRAAAAELVSDKTSADMAEAQKRLEGWQVELQRLDAEVEQLKQQIGEIQLPVDAVKQKRIEVQRAFFLGDDVLESGPGQCSQEFTYKAITGKRDRNAGTFYGIVRPMKDPQRWSNKFFSQILHIINTNAKGGLLAEVDAVDDARDFEDRWAEADSIMWMRPGGSAKVQPKPLTQVPPDVSSMMAFCVQSMREVTGINLELLGMAEAVQPGVLEYQRKQSGLMILATLFNSLRRYHKEQGRLMLYFIQEYIPEGKLVRVQGKEGAQYVPLMKQQDTARYDVVVDEAPSSPNLKEQVFGVLQVLAPQLAAMGVQIPPEALDYMPLPESLVQAIKEANSPEDGQAPVDPAVQVMQAQIQADQMKAQADMQIAQQKLQTETQLKQQQLQSDMALERERLQMEKERADVEAQIASAKLQLEQLKMQAMLNKVMPGATPQLEGSIEQLVATVAQNHADVQNALSEVAQHLRGAGDRQAQMEEVMRQLAAPREAGQ